MSSESSETPHLHLVGECHSISGESRRIDERGVIPAAKAEEILHSAERHLALSLGRLRMYLVLPDGRTVRLPPEIAAALMPLIEGKQSDAGTNNSIGSGPGS